MMTASRGISQLGNAPPRPIDAALNLPDSSASRMLWRLLIWALGLFPAANALLNPRGFGDLGAAVESTGSGLFIPGATALIASGIILLQATRPRLRRSTMWIWLSALLFAIGPILASHFGTTPSFSLDLLGVPLVLTAAYLMPSANPEWFIDEIKRVFLFYVYGSLAVALAAPQWAIEQPYTQGTIPVLQLRLHGIGTHANNLAPFLLGFIACNKARPTKGAAGVVHLAAATMALVLAQSKTVWIAAVLLLLILIGSRLRRMPGLLPIATLAAVVLTGVALVAAAASGMTDASYSTGSATGDSVTSLTGRTLIWAFTILEWQANPLFGYGPDLWGEGMRASYLGVMGWPVPHAHNQLIQTLGESGLVGLVGLVVYVVVLSTFAWRARYTTGGLSIALLVIILIRGLTEPVLRAVTRDGNFFLHFALFALVVLAASRKQQQHAVAPPLHRTWAR